MTSANLDREMHLLSLFIERVKDQRYAELVSPTISRQMVVINLRNRQLTNSHLDSMSHLVLTLYHNLVTGSKDFPHILFKGLFHRDQVTTPFVHVRLSQRENTTPSPPTDSPAGMMLPPAGSSSHPRFLTPVLPEKAALAVLKADRRNCVRTLTVDGLPVTRVISTVYRTVDTEMTNRWRVTDYSADGRVLMSVLCRFLKTSAKGAKRKAPEEENSIRSPTPLRKRFRI
ncbi:ATP-dependent RNA helicase DDX59 [Sarotherodon galilaeus]